MKKLVQVIGGEVVHKSEYLNSATFDPDVVTMIDITGDTTGIDVGWTYLKGAFKKPAGVVVQIIAKALLSNFIVKSNNITTDAVANIYNVKAKLPLGITATVNDIDGALTALLTELDTPKARMTVMAERVRGGNAFDVIDDVRFDMMIDATSLTIVSTSGFDISGNYVVTQERMNKGLKAIGSPFEIEMPMLEFDVINT